jgi:hypothetical protein
MNYISLNDTFEPNKQGSSSNMNQINETWDRSGLAEQLLVSLSEESICSMELFCNVLFFFSESLYNLCTHSCNRSLGSSVSVINRLWAKVSSIKVGLPSEPSESSFLLKQDWGPVSTRDYHQGVKRSRVETYHWPLITSNVDVTACLEVYIPSSMCLNVVVLFQQQR